MILLPSGDAGNRVVLGLVLTRRMAHAAFRAGYARVLALSPPAMAGSESIGSWHDAADFGRDSVLVIASSAVLGETDWLKRLAEWRPERGTWAAAGDRVAVVSGMGLPKALAALEESGARTMADVVTGLTRQLRAPAAMPPGVEPMAVDGLKDIPAAERRLMRALVKDSDGFMAKHVERPISLAISRRLVATSVTANQMTLFSVAVGLLGAPFFLASSPIWQTIGALLFLAHSILDGCDGELARLKFQESRWGGILDFWGDNVVHSAIFAFMAIGWSAAVGALWPLLPGAAAVLGTLGSASFVYSRTMRAKRGHGPLYTSVSTAEGRTARMLDALSRRDFIYLVLLLSLFGRADWFLILAALGAPIFFATLVVLAASERPASAAKPRTI